MNAVFEATPILPSPGSTFATGTGIKRSPVKAERDLLERLRSLIEPQSAEQCVLSNPSGPYEGEHELYWYADTVVWSIGGVQQRRWTFFDDQSIAGACFAWLDSSKLGQYHASLTSFRRSASLSSKVSNVAKQTKTFGPFTHLGVVSSLQPASPQPAKDAPHTRVICIFLHDIGHFYSMDGLEFTINLPFTVKRVWEVLPVGVLLQAALSASDESECRRRGTPMMPLLYSITSPFDEPRAIVFASQICGGMGCTSLGLPLPEDHPHIVRSADPIPPIKWNDQVIYVSPDNHLNPAGPDSLIVTLDSSARLLKLFRYVYVRRNDLPGPLRCPNPKNNLRSGFSLPHESGATVEPEAESSHNGIGFAAVERKNRSVEFEELMKTSSESLGPRGPPPRSEPSILLDRLAIGGKNADEIRQTELTDTPAPLTVASSSSILYPDNRRIKGEIFLENLWEIPVNIDV